MRIFMRTMGQLHACRSPGEFQHEPLLKTLLVCGAAVCVLAVFFLLAQQQATKRQQARLPERGAQQTKVNQEVDRLSRERPPALI